MSLDLINQLSAAYIQRKEKETGSRLAHEDYADELQKIKLYLADNNVFGIDLNPVAVELAEVSLWLNSIHKSGFVPWFGLQLFNGNSQIGARRQVFATDVLNKTKKEQLWFNHTWYDRGERIVFTISKGLVGVGLPRKASKGDTPCRIFTPPSTIKDHWLDWCAEHVSPKNGQFVIDTSDWESESTVVDWEDVQDLDCAIIERTILDDTAPNGPIERVIQYVAQFDLCSREQDYQTVWQHFAANPLEVTTHGS